MTFESEDGIERELSPLITKSGQLAIVERRRSCTDPKMTVYKLIVRDGGIYAEQVGNSKAENQNSSS